VPRTLAPARGNTLCAPKLTPSASTNKSSEVYLDDRPSFERREPAERRDRNSKRRIMISVAPTPVARTLTRASPGPGSGNGIDRFDRLRFVFPCQHERPNGQPFRRRLHATNSIPQTLFSSAAGPVPFQSNISGAWFAKCRTRCSNHKGHVAFRQCRLPGQHQWQHNAYNTARAHCAWHGDTSDNCFASVRRAFSGG
jgi:hypothetical protein